MSRNLLFWGARQHRSHILGERGCVMGWCPGLAAAEDPASGHVQPWLRAQGLQHSPFLPHGPAPLPRESAQASKHLPETSIALEEMADIHRS